MWSGRGTWQQEYDNLLIDTEDGTWKGERDFRTVHRLKSRVKEGMIQTQILTTTRDLLKW